MAKETAQPSPEPLEPHAALISQTSPFEFDLDAAARLGARAEGIEIVTLSPPAECEGLPAAIPVALRRGENPDVATVADLFERYRLHPARKAGTAIAQTFEAFNALVMRHKTADSAIFANMDWKKPSLTAVIDYHEARNGGAAAFGKHRVHYAFPLSEEWKKWIEMDGQPMKQAEFAYFLEDRIGDLSSPTDAERIELEQQFATKVAAPSQVVELSRGLQVRVDTRIKNATTLQTGEASIQFEEAHTDGDGKPLKVPGMFMLNIAPFFMGDKVRIPVRLRYRTGNPLVWFYQIYRPDLHITEHVRVTLNEARKATELPAYEGAPEMAL